MFESSLQIQWISTIDSLSDGDSVLIFMNGRNIQKEGKCIFLELIHDSRRSCLKL